MNDDDIHTRLALLGERAVTPGAEDALARLSRDAERHASRSVDPKRRRHLPLALGLAGAALALTAGTTATAYYLGVPPFVTLAHGELRTSQPIPLRYETRNTIDIACGIYLDFTHTSQEQVDSVDDSIRGTDWSRFGQNLYDAHPELPDAPSLADSLNPQDPIDEEAFDAAYELAAAAIPGLSPRRAHSDTGAPTVSGIDMTCRPDAQ